MGSVAKSYTCMRKGFLIYKENQLGSVAKSYTRKGFLIYEDMCKYLTKYDLPLHSDFLFYHAIFYYASNWLPHAQCALAICYRMRSVR
jgi:hypothetical protein